MNVMTWSINRHCYSDDEQRHQRNAHTLRHAMLTHYDIDGFMPIKVIGKRANNAKYSDVQRERA